MAPYRFPDYQVAGDSDTTVFLLHGAYGAKDYFRPLISTLVNAGYRVVAWDAPGYGISPLPEGGLTIEGLAEAATRLIKREGTACNIVFGHSMGGIAAPLVTLMAGDRVHGLVVSATLGSFARKSADDKVIFLEERIAPLKRGIPFQEAAASVVNSMFAKGSSGERVELVRNVALSMRSDTFQAAIEAIVGYSGTYAGSDVMSCVKVSTLLIAGAEDKVGRPEGMRELAKSLSDARFVAIEGAGHYSFAEQPEAFNAALLGFIADITQTAHD